MKRLIGLVLTMALVFSLAASVFTVGAATGRPSGDAIGSGNGTQPVTGAQAGASMPSATPQADQPKELAASQYGDMAKEMARILNIERQKRGLPLFTCQATHANAAQVRAQDLAVKFDIVRPDGKDWSTVAPKAAYELGAKSAAYPSLSHFFDVWMDSTVLYQQVANKEYNSVAVGYYEQSGVKYGVVHFYKEAGSTLLADGWNKIMDKYCYVKSGQALAGWQSIGSSDYYFNTTVVDAYTGVATPYALTGWQNINNKTFYFRLNGSAGTMGQLFLGWQKIDKRTFYFRKNGALGKRGEMFTGFQSISGQKFYFETTGQDGRRGVLATDWKTIGDYKYYFQKNGGNGARGRMFTGTRTIGGKTYVFDKKGRLTT